MRKHGFKKGLPALPPCKFFHVYIINALQVSVAVKSCGDFPKLCFHSFSGTIQCSFYASSCPIQHVLAELAYSAGEISKA